MATSRRSGGPSQLGFDQTYEDAEAIFPSWLPPLVGTARRVRRPSALSGGGTDATRNDEQRKLVDGNDSLEVQIIEDERHQVELEPEPQLRRFACGIGNCRRRYRNIDKLCTSLPLLSSEILLLILSSCSSTLSAFGRPWRNWSRITRVRAAQMVAAFRADRGSSTVASDTTFADQVCRVTVMAAGPWPVSSFALRRSQHTASLHSRKYICYTASPSRHTVSSYMTTQRIIY